MIKTRSDLRFYIQADRKRMPIVHPYLAALTFSESWSIRRYLTVLRHLEYHKNSYTRYKRLMTSKKYRSLCHLSLSGGVIFHSFLYVFYFIMWRYKSLITGMQVYPNTCGPGLAITHRCFVHVDNLTKIGNNCSILPMVLFGKNKQGKIVVGNNVTFGCGVTVLAPCRIGSNVYVGAGAVVNKDIPDNCVVAGVPAKIIRINKPNEEKTHYND